MGNNCVKCGRVELDHPHFKSAKGPNCKQFIPNHSSRSSRETYDREDKDPSDEPCSHEAVSRIDEGSAFILSDEIEKIMKFHLGHNQGVMHVSEFKKHITNLNAEFIRLLKEVFSPNFEDDWAEKEIDKLAGDLGETQW